jgi:hypothetical protein
MLIARVMWIVSYAREGGLIIFANHPPQSCYPASPLERWANSYISCADALKGFDLLTIAGLAGAYTHFIRSGVLHGLLWKASQCGKPV